MVEYQSNPNIKSGPSDTDDNDDDARMFSGGNAAGGSSSKSLDETLNDFKTIIENYKSQLTQLK
jgi:ATP-dependent Clp protease ATP-binding subunit ClpC